MTTKSQIFKQTLSFSNILVLYRRRHYLTYVAHAISVYKLWRCLNSSQPLPVALPGGPSNIMYCLSLLPIPSLSFGQLGQKLLSPILYFCWFAGDKHLIKRKITNIYSEHNFRILFSNCLEYTYSLNGNFAYAYGSIHCIFFNLLEIHFRIKKRKQRKKHTEKNACMSHG